MFLVAVCISLIVLTMGIITAGLNPLSIIDVPSLIIVMAPTISFGYYSNSAQFNKAFKNLIYGGEYSESERASQARIFEVMGKVAIGASLIGTLIGCIAMLQNLGSGNSAAIGAGIAVALICPLYGTIFAVLFCFPAASKIKG
jgi:flagellar motor component MotA